MIRTARISILTAALVMAVVCFRPLAAPSEDDSTPAESSLAESAISHLVFTELELTPAGVIARDTAGDLWQYDFELDEYAPLNLNDIPGPLSDRDENVLPVEERCTEQKEVKILQQYVLVGYDEYVEGDIIAAGRVVVRGWVKGTVRSLERVQVMPSGQVDGDVEAPEITVKSGGIVYGRQVITTSAMDFVTHLLTAWGPGLVIGTFVFLILFTFVAVSLVPRHLANVRSCVDRYKFRTFIVGFLLLILMVPAMIVFTVTIVGLVATVLIPIAYLMATAAGVIATTDSTLRPLLSKMMRGRPSFMFQSLLGVLFFSVAWFGVASLLISSSSQMRQIGQILMIIACLASLYPVCTGLGAAFLTRLGFRRYVSFRDRQLEGDESAPVPPPIPKAPPVVGRPPRVPAPDEADSEPLSSGNE